MGSQDQTQKNQQTQQTQQTQKNSQQPGGFQSSMFPSLPMSNQERLAMINGATGQAGTGMSFMGIGNGLLQKPIQSWVTSSNRQLEYLARLHRESNSMANLQMLQGGSFADSQRAAALQSRQFGNLQNQFGRTQLASQVGQLQKGIGTTLKIGGATTTAIQGATDTAVATPAGRALNATGQVVTGQLAGHVISLPTAVADVGVSTLLKSPIGKDLPTEVRNTSISGTLSNSVSATSSLVEAATTGNTAGAERYHKESLAGERGIISQTASATGEAIQSIISGNTADYTERAANGEFGVIPQAMNHVGGALHDFIMGDADKPQEEKKGLLQGFGLFGGKK